VEEVLVAPVASEPVAELIAGRLRAEGVPARVRFDSQSGIPRQIAPAGLGFGPGAFRVAVFAHDAGRARGILADAEPQRYRSRPVLRAIATILVIVALISFIPGLVQAVALLFGLER